jgi:hypothetical protein
VKAFYFVLGQVLFPKGGHLAQKIVVDIVPVNVIVIVADHANFAEDFCFDAEFFF